MQTDEGLGSAYLVVGHTTEGDRVVVSVSRSDTILAVKLCLDEADRLAERLKELVERLRSEIS